LKRSTLVAVIVLALCALRLVHLEADVPRDLTTWSVGVFVDEGYKTLDARNLAQFGTAHWHPNDDYPGWRNASPLPHWAYYASFATLGPHLGSARLVTVLCFAALLIGFTASQWRRYSTGLLTLGLVLLGTGHVLFFFSKIALLEVPLALCLCAALFGLARLEERLTLGAVLGLALAAAVATFGIKRSAPVYFAPVALGLLVSVLVGEHNQRRARTLVVLGSLLCAALALAFWWSGGHRLPAFDLAPRHLASSLLWSTMMRSSGPLLALGLACAVHALIVEPRRYLGHPYRASLLALVLLGPLALALFRYQPLRYHAPLLPAHVLLALEWLHLRTWAAPRPARLRWWAVPPLLAATCWLLACLVFSLHRFVLTPLFWPEWKLTDAVPGAALIGFSAVTLLFGLWVGRGLLTGRRALYCVAVLIATAGVRDLFVLGRFFGAPEWRQREISTWLAEHVSPAESVAGDWAPMLTLGTPIKALYMNPIVNRPSRILRLRPDYLLVMGGWPVDQFLIEQGKVDLLPAIFESEYAGRWIKLIPLEYRQPAPR